MKCVRFTAAIWEKEAKKEEGSEEGSEE